MPEPLLDAGAITALLHEVADELEEQRRDGGRPVVVVVGGALLALHGL